MITGGGPSLSEISNTTRFWKMFSAPHWARASNAGPMDMKAKIAADNLPCFAVWTFDVAEIWNESASHTAGTKCC